LHYQMSINISFTEMEDVEANKENETPEMYLPPKDIEGVRSTTANWTVDAIEEEEEDFPVAPPPNHNVTYGLYSLGKNDGGRKINLVVRSSYHAYEVIIIAIIVNHGYGE